MKISRIKMGTRHRQSLGNITALADSIKAVGLLQPVVVDRKGKLIAGKRRIAAAKLLKWTDIPVFVAKTVDDVHKALTAERDENNCREDFSPSDAIAMATTIREFEQKAAAERRGMSNAERAKLSSTERGNAEQKVAAAIGMSRATMEKAEAVVDAAKADPTNYGDLPAKMDKQGKVDPAYEELVTRAAKHPLPDGPTPAQIARRSAGAKWVRSVIGFWDEVGDVDAAGLVADLGDDERRKVVAALREILTAAEEWIVALEKLGRKAGVR